MDRKTGKADHIEDYLVTVRTGQWFGWSNPKNKVYANLIVHDGGAKPSEADCTNGLKALQDAYDAKDYARKRVAAYPKLTHQLDMLYWDIQSGVFGESAKNSQWFQSCSGVKAAYPKSS